MLAFQEDKEMIEAQQRVIDREPERKEMLIPADIGPAQMRGVIARLIAAERTPLTALAGSDAAPERKG
jgi:phenylpropionate dioxygenase-like ring-hydroxylating dioxygenase large terminal subunit